MTKYCFSKTRVMKSLCSMYIINNIDIFNFQASRKNYITYHHLIEVSDLEAIGFPTKKTIENGLALTKYAHFYLHLIEDYAPDIFYHLNEIILLITKEKRLPTIKERSLIQIFLEAFEYRMKEYYNIKPNLLARVPLKEIR